MLPSCQRVMTTKRLEKEFAAELVQPVVAHRVLGGETERLGCVRGHWPVGVGLGSYVKYFRTLRSITSWSSLNLSIWKIHWYNLVLPRCFVFELVPYQILYTYIHRSIANHGASIQIIAPSHKSCSLYQYLLNVGVDPTNYYYWSFRKK